MGAVYMTVRAFVSPASDMNGQEERWNERKKEGGEEP
jgi:hypothetical protein